ncbi:hypothetical protein E2320_014390 [Naja naja]|nr:hypothetical protein E2320_014390 [Naja naja]
MQTVAAEQKGLEYFLQQPCALAPGLIQRGGQENTREFRLPVCLSRRRKVLPGNILLPLVGSVGDV